MEDYNYNISQVKIPEQLHNPNFRFCKVMRMSKKPFEKDWVNNGYGYEEINEWVINGNNYGVLGGFGNLIIIDSDKDRLAQRIDEKLPKTFRVRTGNGGTHDYFYCNGFTKKKVLDNGEHWGEIQSTGSQVIGANSVHPNGKEYFIEQNLPIATIDIDQLSEIIKEFSKEDIELHQHKVIDSEKCKDFGESDINSLDITSIIGTTGFKTATNGELYGSNTWHGSTTGMNLWISPSKNVAKCFRCFPKGTLIYTPEGLRPIENIKRGEIVFGKDGQPNEVKNTFENDYQGFIYSFSHPIPKIEMTQEHPLLVYRIKQGRVDKFKKGNAKGELIWTTAGEFNKATDFIAFPKNYTENIKNIGEYKLDRKLGRLIGRYLADGNLTKQFNITFGINKEDYAKESVKLIKEIFKGESNYNLYPNKGTCVLTSSNKELIKIANEFGRGAKNKNFGKYITAPNEFLQAALETYFEGDGHIRKDTKTKVINSLSEKLIREFQFIQFRNSKIFRYIIQNESNNPHSKNPKHSVYWSNDNGTFEDNNFIFIKVMNLTKTLKKCKVYNIETEDNTYLVPNVVHNCDTGITVAKAIALNEGIVSNCNDYLSKDQFIQVLKIANEKYGLKKPELKIEKDKKEISNFDEIKDFNNLKDHITDYKEFGSEEDDKLIYTFSFEDKKLSLEGREIMDFKIFRYKFFQVFKIAIPNYKNMNNEYFDFLNFVSSKFTGDRAYIAPHDDSIEAKELILDYLYTTPLIDKVMITEGINPYINGYVLLSTKIIRKLLKTNEFDTSLRKVSYILKDYYKDSRPYKIDGKSARFWRFYGKRFGADKKVILKSDDSENLERSIESEDFE